MGGEDLVRVKILIPNGKTEITVSDSISRVHDVSRQQGLAVDWIQESEFVSLVKLQDLNNLPEVLVYDPSSNYACINNIIQLSREGILTVIGPQCLLMCLDKNCSLPDTRYPVLNGAMRGCVVTSTGVTDVELKQKLRDFVERMWGQWSDSLHDGVTHLVAASVLSEKYKTAISAGLPVMSQKWIEEVWKLSMSHLDITAVDKRFSQYKCPPMLGIRVCVTQLERQDRELVKSNVEACGGEYSGRLDTDTSILVCASGSGDKWSAARKWGIPCVTVGWVMDCVEKGECADPAAFRVHRATPVVNILDNKSHEQSLVQEKERPNVFENAASNNSTLSMKRSRTSDSILLNNSNVANTSLNNTTLPMCSQSLMQDLNLKVVKQSGMFLDGCKVYLGGFNKEDESHVSRVLKYSGAVKLSQLVESITHVILSDLSSAENSSIHKMLSQLDLSPVVVDVGWIVASMKAGKPISDTEYFYQTNNEASEEADFKIDDKSNPIPMEEDSHNYVDKLQFENDLLAQYK